MLSKICWTLPHKDLILYQNEAHVWLEKLLKPVDVVEKLEKILSDDERERSGKFIRRQDAESFIIARGTLRIILGKYLNVDPSSICFDYGPFGKPCLPEKSNISEISFSLSHSAGYGLYIITRQKAVGIDIEYSKPLMDLKIITDKIFSKNEKDAFNKLSDIQKQDIFFYIWTRKEAYIKANGFGFNFPVSDIDVLTDTLECKSILFFNDTAYRETSFLLNSFIPIPNFIASTAIEGEKSCSIIYYSNTIEY